MPQATFVALAVNDGTGRWLVVAAIRPDMPWTLVPSKLPWMPQYHW